MAARRPRPGLPAARMSDTRLHTQAAAEPSGGGDLKALFPLERSIRGGLLHRFSAAGQRACHGRAAGLYLVDRGQQPARRDTPAATQLRRDELRTRAIRRQDISPNGHMCNPQTARNVNVPRSTASSAAEPEAVAATLRTGLQPLCGTPLRGSGSHATTTLRQDYRLAG